jgi:class 3 adenylate cyclase/predicted ATPase
MQTEQELRFGPYRLNLEHGQLWRGTQAVKLTPKALAVLRQLVQQSGQVVSKEELFQTVWADTVVSDAALTFCIQELRRALRDNAKESRYIETVHRRGFRFIGQLNALQGRTKTPTETVHRKRVDGVREIERKLVAILSADVKGYSRLMGEDEVATIHTLTAYREVMAALIQQHRGRVVDSPGDNLLAEFASVVDAVQGAIEVQKALKVQNAALSVHRRMEFRIGINLGDVIVEGGRIYGDGVNIAARVESLAEPGGICVSGTVHEHVKSKLALRYEDLGERVVKNIAEPVRVYRVTWESGEHAAPSPATITQAVSSRQYPVSNRQKAVGSQQLPIRLLGREAELTQLYEYWEKALNGERQVVFVAGEPGIGKTTLVEAFLTRLADEHEHEPWLGQGQCIEHYGAGEAYLPLLEALGRLGRESGGQRLIELLSQQAPTWLVQMPALLTATELEMLQRKTQGVTHERMLRELTEAMEALTAERPLVLWLEDLHWGDVSTLDWLAFVARRRESSRLLVIGTYRPVDVLVQGHPLRAVKQELQTRGYCTELLLDFLNEEDIAKYLAVRFAFPSPFQEEDRGKGASRTSLQRLACVIHRRTDGNPLFMVNVVNDLLARGVLVQSDGRWELKEREEELEDRVPDNLQQLIGQQIERLSPETQRMLEVASVAGAEFSAAAVAAGMETEVEGIEEQCEALVRQEHFLRASGTANWPDGTVAARYGFLHALYQDVLYNRLTARRRQRLHQQIGEREEAAYGERTREIAAELAVHFEQGRDYRKAVQYLQHAGEKALKRSANIEAISHLAKGLELLEMLPDTPECTQQELRLQLALGGALIALKGYSAPEVERAYTRAVELGRQLDKTPEVLSALMGLATVRVARAEHKTARELLEQCLLLAQRRHSLTLLWAHYMLAAPLYYLGEFTLARDHFDQGIALYDRQKHTPLVSGDVQDLRVACLSFGAMTLWHLGYPDQALKSSQEALTRAQELSHPFSLAYALDVAALLHQFRRERQLTQERAEAAIPLCTDQGFLFWLAYGTMLRGWALTKRGQGTESIAQLSQGMAAWRAMGAEQMVPYFLALLAEAYGEVGQAEEGVSALSEALTLANKTAERWWEAELYRLKGELTLQSKTGLNQVSGKSKASQDKSRASRKQVKTSLRQVKAGPQSPTPKRRRRCIF